MKISYNWLKEILQGLKIKPEKLAEILSTHIGEVKQVIKLKEDLNKIIVSQIKEIIPHPQADRLKIVKVQTKLKGQIKELTVVCGANNIKKGQKVPLALPGAKIMGQEIKETVIRKVKSEGMLCAEDELAIGEDHTGIYILPNWAKLGQSVFKLLELDDTILEIENSSITHRSDLFGHFGLAREINACLNSVKIKKSFPYLQEAKFKKTKNKKVDIEIKDSELSPRYMAVMMEGIKVEPSPWWLKNRLRNLGIRSINNIVDISNYVLLETGQPLHIFDQEKLEGGKIIVRRARNGEKIFTLDEKEHELNNNDLVIADKKKPVALAGIMGGQDSGISQKTRRIIIESANFNPASIRQTAQRLSLRTEASLRFEKGLPFNFPEIGMARAIELIEKLCSGKRTSQIFDFQNKEVKKNLTKEKSILVDFEQLNSLAGCQFAKKDVIKILKTLGFKIKRKENKVWAIVPISRRDINIMEDLVEEVVRIYGLNKIKPQPIVSEIKPVLLSKEFVLEKKIKDILLGAGFDEINNYIFYGQPAKTEVKHLELSNPLNPDQRYLRASLLPNLGKNIEKNRPVFEEIKIFELGNVFYEKDNKVLEKKHLAGIIYGEENLFFKAKGMVETIYQAWADEEDKLNYKFFSLDKAKEWIDLTKDGLEVIVLSGQDILGIIGEKKIEDYKVGFFEIDLSVLLNEKKKEKKYQPISKYEPVKRDLAFLIDKRIPCQKVEIAIKNIDPLIKEVELFDVFSHKRFGEKRNLAFHIIYQSHKRTLKSEEVDNIQEKIIRDLKEKFQAQLRTF